jgi:hypothetical protein
MMYMVSLKLGDEKAAEEYARMWREVNYKRTGGPAGVED